MECRLQILPAKHFMAWEEWRVALKFRLWVAVIMHLEMCLMVISASKTIFRRLPIHGGKCISTRRLVMMKTRLKNILCYTFCMAAARMRPAGQDREKPI